MKTTTVKKEATTKASNHIKKVKPSKRLPTRTTGISCPPTGGPDSAG
ncbi:MAG: hypothetical protein H7061_05565 [Bdellovibrionaceae bacterium]|nr:hypothetical protein [Bdellovibrio sp.]